RPYRRRDLPGRTLSRAASGVARQMAGKLAEAERGAFGGQPLTRIIFISPIDGKVATCPFSPRTSSLNRPTLTRIRWPTLGRYGGLPAVGRPARAWISTQRPAAPSVAFTSNGSTLTRSIRKPTG